MWLGWLFSFDFVFEFFWIVGVGYICEGSFEVIDRMEYGLR